MKQALQEGAQLWLVFEQLASLHVLCQAAQTEAEDEDDVQGSGDDVGCSHLPFRRNSQEVRLLIMTVRRWGVHVNTCTCFLPMQSVFHCWFHDKGKNIFQLMQLHRYTCHLHQTLYDIIYPQVTQHWEAICNLLALQIYDYAYVSTAAKLPMTCLLATIPKQHCWSIAPVVR